MVCKTVVFDVDGTICEERRDGKWLPKELPYGARMPYPRMVEIINRLYDEGWEVVLYTARYMERCRNIDTKDEENLWIYAYKELANWCNLWGIKYSSIKLHKPSAAVYVDNRAFRCDSEKGESEWKRLEEHLAGLS